MQLRWRESTRSGIPLFPVTHTSDLSYVQLWLLHWVQVYDWAFSLPEGEKPADSVFDEDEKFDDWYKQYSAQKMKEARQASASRGSSSSHDNVITF